MLPKHIGFIMDGNGRWAKKQGKPRSFGHAKGAEVLEGLCDHLFEKGVRCLSFYAFSTENWSRPEEEVKKLNDLLVKFVKKFLPTFIKNKTRLVISGDLTSPRISESTRKKIMNAVEKTSEFTEHIVNICYNYGSRSEIVHAVNALLERGESVTERSIEENLWTNGLGDVDLIVRTSGEQRLSNFLLWQSAYAELYFTDCLWPDFTNDEADKALTWFENRKRTFGGV